MISRNKAWRRRKNEGFALLAVLGFMLLLAMLLMPFAASSRVKALTVSYEYDHRRLGYAAEAINHYLAWRLGSDLRWGQLVEDGRFVSLDCTTGDLAAIISVVPHARLINLNTAEEALLEVGFREVGLDGAEAEDMARKVMQFRSARISGSEEVAGVNSGLKHAPFEDISELHDFDTLHRFTLTELGRIFSAHSGRAVPSEANGDFSTSDYYTISTFLFVGESWGNDAAVFQAGNAPDHGKRIATIRTETKPARPAQGATTCEAVVDHDVAHLLVKALM